MPGQPPANELLRDSVEAYFAATPLHAVRPIYLGLLLALAGGAAALPLVHLDVTARARGLLRPSVELHRVAAGMAGVVERVSVRRGQAVRAGEVLVTLRGAEVTHRLAESDSAAAELRARAADLGRLIELANELAQGRGRAAAARLARYRDEAARLRHEWTDLRAEAEAARAEAARAGALGRLGLAAPAELERASLQRDRTGAAPRLLAERQRTSWAAELQDVLTQLRRTDGERSELVARAALLDIRSPVRGTVAELSPVSAGSWVAAGEELAVVSPEAPLVAEVYVDSRDVGRIRRNLPVRLLVDAFDHHEWGTLPARVTEVAEDYTLVNGQPVFRIRCALLRRELRARGRRIARPGKGLGVTAAFVLGRRSLFHLIWDGATSDGDDDPAPATP